MSIQLEMNSMCLKKVSKLELQIKGGIEDNSKIIILISQ